MYVRTDAFSTERARPADVRRIIESAVGKTGAAIARLVARPPTDAVIGEPAPEATARPIFATYPTRRALSLRPLDDPSPVRLSQLENLIQESRATAHGHALIPRYVDPGILDDAFVLRRAEGLVIELEREAFGGANVMSVVEASRTLRVRLSESLWEDTAHAVGAGKVDITAMFRFAYGSLLFAWRLYASAGVVRFRFEVGLTSPLGRTLTVDPARFMGPGPRLSCLD